MAYTFLQGVNKTLKRTKIIAGDAGDLTTFTDSARQEPIDTIIQIWNEVTHELFIHGAFPIGEAAGTITLALNTREYALPSNFERVAGTTWENRAFMCATKTNPLLEYPGGYLQMMRNQTNPDNYNGQPSRWAISPVTGYLRIDTNPQAAQVGDVYAYTYEKRLSLTAIADTFPYSDTVVDSLVPLVAELYRQAGDGTTREAISANKGFLRALQLIRRTGPRNAYGVRRGTPRELEAWAESV